MNYKEYVKKWFGIDMTDAEVDELERFLVRNASEIKDASDLKGYIRHFIIDKNKGKSLRLIKEADNSDLEQMLKLIKAKADKK